jgi:hypothetical protein
MNPVISESPRYTDLRRGGKVLHRLGWWVQLGFLFLGLGLFLDQARGLLSDAQFTTGERQVMGLIALITIGGCGLAGWVVGRLFRVSAGILDVLADSAEASWRTGDLIEQHLIPTLGRIALALEEHDDVTRGTSPRLAAPRGVDALRSDLAEAQTAGRAGRVMELRDQLTQHLRGEPLHTLDLDLALWLLKLVERRVQAGTVDAEVAGWVARALDSFGEMPEAQPLRAALPALRRRAGLCQRCGSPVRGSGPVCPDCRTGRTAPSTSSSPVARSARSPELS